MRVALIIILILIFLLLVPFKLKAKVCFNVLDNRGILALKLGCIRLFLGRARFKLKQLIVEYGQGKVYQTSLTQFNKSNNFADIFILNVFHEIKVNTLKVYANIGYKKDAYLTAMLVGCVDVPLGIALGLFKNIKPSAKIVTGIYPNFLQNNLFLALSSSVSINLFTIILCLAKALLKTRGGNKNGK